MKITFKSVDESNIIIDTTSNTTMREILSILSEKRLIPENNIRLVYAGMCIEYDPNKTLQDWNITDNSTIHLVKKEKSFVIDIPFTEYVDYYKTIKNQENEIQKLTEQLENALLQIKFLSSGHE